MHLNGCIFQINFKVIIISLSDIFSDALKYPFSDITKFLIVGVIALLAGFSSVVNNFQINNTAVSLFAAIVALVFALILSGYGVSVIRRGIQHSDEIPDVDLKENLITGIKALIIQIIYFLIPLVITFILMLITGTIGAGLDHVAAGLGIGAVIAVIFFIAFAIFETVAIARFAKTDEIGEALNLGEVIEDVKKIGILQILAFVIIAFFIIFLAFIIAGIIGVIPYIGIVIGTLLAGGFVVLFYNKALGLLYSQI